MNTMQAIFDTAADMLRHGLRYNTISMTPETRDAIGLEGKDGDTFCILGHVCQVSINHECPPKMVYLTWKEPDAPL